MKRAVDVVVGSILAALTFPFVLVFAIGCAASLRAWPIFVQRRVGKDGKPFPLPKLRTLPTTAPPAVDKYALEGTHIPRFCRLLRRTHLDELPQLFVVPLGWMSLVGPRPEMPSLLARYPANFAAARSRVRPGCTGLWQISTSSGRLIYESPEYDLVYANYQGLRLDAWILYRTLLMLTAGRAAIDLDNVPGWALNAAHASAMRAAASVDFGDEAAEDAVVIDLRDRDADDVMIVELRKDRGEEALVIDIRDREPATAVVIDLRDEVNEATGAGLTDDTDGDLRLERQAHTQPDPR